jgi:hypothetical protein
MISKKKAVNFYCSFPTQRGGGNILKEVKKLLSEILFVEVAEYHRNKKPAHPTPHPSSEFEPPKIEFFAFYSKKMLHFINNHLTKKIQRKISYKIGSYDFFFLYLLL